MMLENPRARQLRSTTKNENDFGMEAPPMLLTKSRFFIPAFNTAIIDGPLRIYFSDKQEEDALHIYFEIQERLSQVGLQLTALPGIAPHTFVMLYPSKSKQDDDYQSYETIFSESKIHTYDTLEGVWSTDRFGENLIFGIKDYSEKSFREKVSQMVSEIIRSAAAL